MEIDSLADLKPVDFNLLVRLRYGEEYVCTGLSLEDGAFQLEVESKDIAAICPCCGTKSEAEHAVYRRKFKDLPIGGIPLNVIFKARTYNCTNPECGVSTFVEPLPFVGRNQKRSIEMDNVILVVSSMTGARTASERLAQVGIDVSVDAIYRLSKKIHVTDDPNVEIIGIDEIAIEKGRKYVTVIYDGETGEFLRLLKGRDKSAVDGWLKAHPKIKIVARDRASAYAAAVKADLPNAEQIADRFHLFQNMIDHLETYLRDNLPKEIWVDEGKVYIADQDATDDWLNTTDIIVEKHKDLAYDNTAPQNKDHSEITVDSQRHLSAKETASAEKRRKKQDMIRDMQREQREHKQPVAAVAKKWGVCWSTANKYLQMIEAEIDALEKPSPKPDRGQGAAVANTIYKMMKDDVSDRVTFSWIRAHNPDIADSAIVYTMQNVQANHFPGKKAVNRESLLSLAAERSPSPTATKISRNRLKTGILTLKPKEKDDPVALAMPSIVARIPAADYARTAFTAFHTIIMDHHPEKLLPFIDHYIEEGPLASFSNGLKMDIDAVKNAATSPINSGFVEGSNTKAKLIKRAGYGRASIPTLERRLWVDFQITKKHRRVIAMVQYPQRRVALRAA